MKVRRARVLDGGFEAFRLPTVRRSPPGPFPDFQLNQGGDLPRRVFEEMVPPVPPGPIVTPAGFDRNKIVGMLDLATSQIGRSIPFGSALSGRSAPLLQAQASDQKCRQLTVNLSVHETVLGADRDLVALVSWGAGGMQIADLEVDFINGCTFSVTASFLRIIVRSDAPPGTVSFEVGAFFGYENRPGSRSPQRTIKVGPIVATNAVDVRVPRFATHFNFVRQPLASVILLQFIDGTGAVVMGEIPVAAGADVSQNDYPIPGNAVFVRVAVTTADLTAGRLVFGLAL